MFPLKSSFRHRLRPVTRSNATFVSGMKPAGASFVSVQGRPLPVSGESAKCPRRKKTQFFRRAVVSCIPNSERRDETPLLEMRNVSYQVPMNYDVQLFENMTFKAYAGEFVIVIGENGSGKSTGTLIALPMQLMTTPLERRRRHFYCFC